MIRDTYTGCDKKSDPLVVMSLRFRKTTKSSASDAPDAQLAHHPYISLSICAQVETFVAVIGRGILFLADRIISAVTSPKLRQWISVVTTQ